MIPLVVGFAVSIVAFSSQAQGLSCLPCNDTICPNVSCDSTVVKDACGCCPVCSKKRGEECGGPWNISGVCDPEADLVCDRFVPPGELEFNMIGQCVRNGTQGLCKHPQVFSECARACQATCNETMPQICSLQCLEDPCVCGQGFIRRSATDRKCIPTTECDAPDPITCEYPKIRSECATACPATCDEPFPFICTRNCDQDPCVCPSGFLMRSRTDRRCIRDFECANYSFCETNCSPIDIRANAMELRKTWQCHLKKWQCTTYKWKMDMTKWWFQSCNGGRDVVDNLWEDMKNMCEPMPNIRCKNVEATQCSVDAMGCRLCECSDGLYEDPSELLVLWKRNFQVFSAYLDIYEIAKANCVGGC